MPTLAVALASAVAAQLPDNQNPLLGNIKAAQDLQLSDPARFARIIRESRIAAVAEEVDDEQWREPRAGALPTVLAHGVGDGCHNAGMKSITEAVGKRTGTYATCPSIGGNAVMEAIYSFLHAGGMDGYVDKFAEQVRSDDELKDGFNCIGFSQGGSVCRGYIQKYNSPPVRTLLSVHGPVMGVQGFPRCNEEIADVSLVCKVLLDLYGEPAYIAHVQNNILEASYYRDPIHSSSTSNVYLMSSQLAAWNNEGDVNEMFKQNFLKTQQFVTVRATNDTLVFPHESSWWGSFEDGNFTKVQTMRQTRFYEDDLFGLQTADQAGRIHLESTVGDHMRFTKSELFSWIDRYLFATPLGVQSEGEKHKEGLGDLGKDGLDLSKEGW